MIVDERLGNNAKKDLMIEKKGVNQFAAQTEGNEIRMNYFIAVPFKGRI